MQQRLYFFAVESQIGIAKMDKVRLNVFKPLHMTRGLLGQYLATLITVLLATFALFNLRSYLGDANISLLYLLIVLFCAATANPRVTIFCGVLSFLCYDFFLIPPIFDIRPSSPIKLLDPLAFFVVALVTGILAERSRQYAVEKATYQQASQFRTTLLHLVSHNLRTPLATIKTALSSLLASPTMPPLELLTAADHECDRLNRLISNVLQLSRLDADAIQLHKDWNGLDDVVSTVFSRWRTEVTEKKLSASFPESLPLIQFDFELIESVLTNLVENAFRHGSPPVKVGIDLHDKSVNICVEDCGHSLVRANQTKLFHQFSTSKMGGLGLGLAVCKGLITAHGGRIWVESDSWRTRFIFSLPLVPYPGDDENGDEPHPDR